MLFYECVRKYLFRPTIEAFSALETIEEFVKFVDRIAVDGLHQEQFNIPLTHFVLQFHEEVNYGSINFFFLSSLLSIQVR